MRDVICVALSSLPPMAIIIMETKAVIETQNFLLVNFLFQSTFKVNSSLEFVFVAEFLIEIPQVDGVLSDDAVSDGVFADVCFILFGDVQDVSPLVRTVVNSCAALSRKAENGVPVRIDPHSLNLSFQFFELFISGTIELLAEPLEDSIPRIELERRYLHQREQEDKP